MLAQSSTDAPQTKSHHPFSPLPSNKSRKRDTRTCLFQSGYSQLNHHKRDCQITRTKISYSLYSLMEPQPLSCTPACCYKFDTAAVHPPLIPPKIYSTSSRIRTWNPNGGLRWSSFEEAVNVSSPLAVFAEELRHRCLTEF